jgi:hypothetical protein
MPLFKRKTPREEPRAAEADPAEPRLCGPEEIRAMVAWQVEQASAAGAGFCVLWVVPQILPGERIAGAEARIVSGAIVAQLREDDRAGVLPDDAYLVMLAHKAFDGAQIVAHRLATEFTVRSAHVNRRNWRVGIAVFPDDGITAETLAEAAEAAAKRTMRAA